ncbi:GvpL/GvpF family gas vesicle protein [Amycolatopsis sp. 195334CR]|uniref:GvpL/GvpF family gas vesicle protein n=1 Tax=Amycolatopsis sp. 195334CR TaxID=2814588 RepID=UPI001A8DFA60|nr:GvpL/GvpF family gas vesicle protein [Amycolatopsis sp. 195334CR]MBN6038980.1 GvpL/GvpF family gas vesicle protein [Amycolatopsis sp. 195334CR]
MTRGLCAYAITRDTARPPADTRLITHRGLALVVAETDLAAFAELDTDPAAWVDEPSEHDPLVILARRHDAVVRAVFEHQPVLPFRFGTILRDRAAAVRLLTERHTPAGEALDRVAGHREWGVRARSVPDTGEREPAGDLSGTEYLAMRRRRLAAAERTRRRGAGAAAGLHEALLRLATDCAPKCSPGLLLDTAYLVHADRETEFHAEIERVRGEVLVDITGPWPPYSFARSAAADA